MNTPLSETFEDRVRAINEGLLNRVIKTTTPTVEKVGPKGYSHGWVKAVGPISGSDLKVKGNGDIVHKPSGNKLGWLKTGDDGKTRAFAGDKDGKRTLVYEGARDKSKALNQMATHHNWRNFQIKPPATDDNE